jgi:hypothetical protein
MKIWYKLKYTRSWFGTRKSMRQRMYHFIILRSRTYSDGDAENLAQHEGKYSQPWYCDADAQDRTIANDRQHLSSAHNVRQRTRGSAVAEATSARHGDCSSAVTEGCRPRGEKHNRGSLYGNGYDSLR